MKILLEINLACLHTTSFQYKCISITKRVKGAYSNARSSPHTSWTSTQHLPCMGLEISPRIILVTMAVVNI